jgi:glyoxylase-like metal-dependent hydrolase (beta-lactamase superfamily II)
MIDPSRLVAGARAVYGDAVFDEVYGEITGVDAARVSTVADYDTLELGGRTLEFIHTRGHANHHMCILDKSTGDIFTGDTFGQAYPDLQNNGLFIFPSSSPTEFDGRLAIESIDKILDLKPKRACLTHYGPIDSVQEAGEILKTDLREYERNLAEARLLKDEDKLHEFCKVKTREYFIRKLQERNMSLGSDVEDLLTIDMNLNSDGLAYQAILRNKKETTA